MIRPHLESLSISHILEKDPKKIEEIRKELIEIDNEKLKVFKGNCPFAH